MADNNKDLISNEVLQKATQDILQAVVEHVYDYEEYSDEFISDLFQLTPEEAKSISEIINDEVVSKYKLWSSQGTTNKINEAKLECQNYSNELIKDLSSISLEWCETSLPTIGEVNKIYVLPVISGGKTVNTLNIWNSTTSAYVSIGNLEIDLTTLYTKSEIDTMLADYAKKTEVLSIDNVITDTSKATGTNVLSASTSMSELDKKVDKTNITTSIDSSSKEEEVPSAKTVYEELDGKLTNSYYKNNESKKGIAFDNNADGSYFTIRPYLPENMLQITKNDTDSLLDIYSDGTITGKGGKCINDLTIAYKNVIKDTLNIHTQISESKLNNAGLVTPSSSGAPSDMECGIREVIWIAKNKVIVRITGIDTSGMPAIWLGRYNGTDWAVWRKL